MTTAVIWSRSKPEVEFQYGGRLGEFNGMSSQSHVTHCRVLPPGEFNVMSAQSHVLAYIAGCCHLVNLMTQSQNHVPHCKVLPPGEFSVMVSERRATLQGAATWQIQCHDPRATCHIAGWKNSIRHIENRFSPYFIFCFHNAVSTSASSGFRIVFDTLVLQKNVICMSSELFDLHSLLQGGPN